VPEAAIDEYGDFYPRPRKVRATWKILVSTPTADLVAPKEKRETLFGGRVPAAAHP